MTALVQPVSGSRLLAYADGVRTVFADAFGSPPRGEGPERADACLRRLRDDVDRPGFTAALALDGDTVLGWATAWTTPSPFLTGRCHPQISAALGRHRTADCPGHPPRPRGSRPRRLPRPRHPARAAAPRPLEPLRPEQ
ncbi:hypothetical protein [Streptomyces sp. NPDC001809]